jgi:hypothetical protein
MTENPKDLSLFVYEKGIGYVNASRDYIVLQPGTAKRAFD